MKSELAKKSNGLSYIKYIDICSELNDEVIEKEVGAVFVQVLEHAGVYKRNAEGKQAFLNFVERVNQ